MAKKINEVLFQTGVVPVIRLENPERDAAPAAVPFPLRLEKVSDFYSDSRTVFTADEDRIRP